MRHRKSLINRTFETKEDVSKFQVIQSRPLQKEFKEKKINNLTVLRLTIKQNVF